MVKNTLKGMIIGLANIIPGVSGGTMAVSMGIYDQLIYCISHFFSNLKKNILFLMPILIGMGIAIIGSSFGIDYLFETFPVQTNLFFIGLILGSLPTIYNQVKRKPIHKGYIVSAVVFFVLVVGMALLNGYTGNEIVLSVGVIESIKLFFVGIIASATMVIPGVSGSMMLLLLGYYNPILACIKSFMLAIVEMNIDAILENLLILIPFGLGVIIGIIVIAKLIEVILKKFPLYAYWAIIGLIVASPIAILVIGSFPNLTIMKVITGLVTFVLGFFISIKLGEK